MAHSSLQPRQPPLQPAGPRQNFRQSSLQRRHCLHHRCLPGAASLHTRDLQTFWLQDRLAEQAPRDKPVMPPIYEALLFQSVQTILVQEASSGTISTRWRLHVQDHGEAGDLARTFCELAAYKGIQ